MQHAAKTIAFVMGAALATAAVNAADRPAAPSAAASAGVSDLFEDPVIARGKGLEIKRSHLEEAFMVYRANLAAAGESISEEQRPAREMMLLGRLMTTRLLVSRATEADQTKGKELADRLIAETRNEAGSPEAFNRRLKVMGMSLEDYNSRVLEQALAQAVLDRDLKAKIAISDARISEFYKTGSDLLVTLLQTELERLVKDANTTVAQLTQVKQRIEDVKKANLAKLEQPEKVRVSHVLIATRQKDTEEELPAPQKKQKRQQIEQLLARAKAGADFSKLVQEYSEDRRLKETKGEYTLARQDPFVPEFKAAAFSLNPGQISDVVTTTFGYHIIKLLEKIPAQKVELEKVAPEIRDFLLQQELQKQMPEYFARLRNEAGVEILDPKYNFELPKDIAPLKPAG